MLPLSSLFLFIFNVLMFNIIGIDGYPRLVGGQAGYQNDSGLSLFQGCFDVIRQQRPQQCSVINYLRLELIGITSSDSSSTGLIAPRSTLTQRGYAKCAKCVFNFTLLAYLPLCHVCHKVQSVGTNLVEGCVLSLARSMRCVELRVFSPMYFRVYVISLQKELDKRVLVVIFHLTPVTQQGVKR